MTAVIEAIEASGEGNESIETDEVEALIRSVQEQMDAPHLGKLAIHKDWPHEIVFGLTPGSTTEHKSLRSALFSGVTTQIS